MGFMSVRSREQRVKEEDYLRALSSSQAASRAEVNDFIDRDKPLLEIRDQGLMLGGSLAGGILGGIPGAYGYGTPGTTAALGTIGGALAASPYVRNKYTNLAEQAKNPVNIGIGLSGAAAGALLGSGGFRSRGLRALAGGLGAYTASPLVKGVASDAYNLAKGVYSDGAEALREPRAENADEAPTNLAEFIDKRPYQAALATAGLGGLTYHALGGHEGIADKVQAMKDNPLATAAGLGTAGVLSKITYDAMNKEANYQGYNHPQSNSMMIMGPPVKDTIYRRDMLGNVMPYNIKQEDDVDNLLKVLEAEKRHTSLLSGLGGAITGATAGGMLADKNSGGMSATTGAIVGGLSGLGLGALLGYGGATYQQNLTKDLYGIRGPTDPKPAREKVSQLGNPLSAALNILSKAKKADRDYDGGHRLQDLLSGPMSMPESLLMSMPESPPESPSMSLPNPFSSAMSVSEKIKTKDAPATAALLESLVGSKNDTTNMTPAKGELDWLTPLNPFGYLYDSDDTKRDSEDTSVLGKIMNFMPGPDTFGLGIAVSNKAKAKSQAEDNALAKADNFIDNYGGYMLGAGALAGLGYGGHKLYNHLTKESGYGEDVYNMNYRTSEISTPRIAGYGLSKALTYGLPIAAVAGGLPYLSGYLAPAGSTARAIQQSAFGPAGLKVGLGVGALAGAALAGTALYKRYKARKEGDAAFRSYGSWGKSNYIKDRDNRMNRSGKSLLQSASDLDKRLGASILGGGMSKENAHTPRHQSKYTAEYNHNSLLHGNQKTELPDFLQKEIIDAKAKTASRISAVRRLL